MDGNVYSLKIAIAINPAPAIDRFFFFFFFLNTFTNHRSIITTDSLTRAFLITRVCFIITYSFLKSLAVHNGARPLRDEGNGLAPLLHSTRPPRYDHTFNILLQWFFFWYFMYNYAAMCLWLWSHVQTGDLWEDFSSTHILTLNRLIKFQLTRGVQPGSGFFQVHSRFALCWEQLAFARNLR